MHGWSFIDRGAEPDNAYYIRNQSIVAGRNVDLASDPPPDLIVEVDIGHSGIDENSLYTAIGIGGIAVWSGTFTNCKETLYTG
ncbi:MAG: hypothetical protein HC856_05955 [Pseudanabaena sp. RU_4_16]|nr:hypothetical protein [Pseudanabaena sp. SU_2_4]NJM27880.1 hypothetical protein [Pseudanabaena sp. RU_4_16]